MIHRRNRARICGGTVFRLLKLKLKLLVYSLYEMRPQAASVCGLKPLVYAASSY